MHHVSLGGRTSFAQLRSELGCQRCAAAEGAPLSLHPIWPTPPPARTRVCNGAQPHRPHSRPPPEYARIRSQMSTGRSRRASRSTRCCRCVSARPYSAAGTWGRAFARCARTAAPPSQPPAARIRPNTLPIVHRSQPAHREALGAAAGWCAPTAFRGRRGDFFPDPHAHNTHTTM